MNFSVVGNHPAALRLLTEIIRSGEHELRPSAISGQLLEGVLAARLPVRLAPTSEDAVLAGHVDAAVLAIDESAEALRLVRAALQADRQIVLVPPVCSSPAFSFELHLIFDEFKGSVVPLTGRFDLELRGLVEDELQTDPGRMVQLAVELPVASESDLGLKIAMERGLDVLLACGLRYTQVTVLDSRAPDGGFLSRLITLNSGSAEHGSLPPAALTLKPAAAFSEVRPLLKIMQSDGTVRSFAVSDENPVLPRLLRLLTNRERCADQLESWSMTLELAEAAAKSLRRRRTVDVHFDSGSERGVFKSQMTAIGCGVLTFMLLGMVAYLIVAQLVELPDWALHSARILWILPLVVFLIAQALLPLSRDRTIER